MYLTQTRTQISEYGNPSLNWPILATSQFGTFETFICLAFIGLYRTYGFEVINTRWQQQGNTCMAVWYCMGHFSAFPILPTLNLWSQMSPSSANSHRPPFLAQCAQCSRCRRLYLSGSLLVNLLPTWVSLFVGLWCVQGLIVRIKCPKTLQVCLLVVWFLLVRLGLGSMHTSSNFGGTLVVVFFFLDVSFLASSLSSSQGSCCILANRLPIRFN